MSLNLCNDKYALLWLRTLQTWKKSSAPTLTPPQLPFSPALSYLVSFLSVTCTIQVEFRMQIHCAHLSMRGNNEFSPSPLQIHMVLVIVCYKKSILWFLHLTLLLSSAWLLSYLVKFCHSLQPQRPHLWLNITTNNRITYSCKWEYITAVRTILNENSHILVEW
jgi:hypothetical protein